VAEALPPFGVCVRYFTLQLGLYEASGCLLAGAQRNAAYAECLDACFANTYGSHPHAFAILRGRTGTGRIAKVIDVSFIGYYKHTIPTAIVPHQSGLLASFGGIFAGSLAGVGPIWAGKLVGPDLRRGDVSAVQTQDESCPAQWDKACQTSCTCLPAPILLV